MEREDLSIFILHGVTMSVFFLLVSSLLSLGEWFVKALSDWEGVVGGFPWWSILFLTIIFYPPAFIYYRENRIRSTQWMTWSQHSYSSHFS